MPATKKKRGEITIGKAEKPFYSRRPIFVFDGKRDVLWGYAHRDSQGPRGYDYYFTHAHGGGRITDKQKNQICVSSDAGAWSNMRYRHTYKNEPMERPKPTEVRLLETVKSMIDHKLLRHPNKLADEAQKRTERWRLQAEQSAKRADAKLRKRAESVLSNSLLLPHIGKKHREHLIGLIVAAMKWAQTQ